MTFHQAEPERSVEHHDASNASESSAIWRFADNVAGSLVTPVRTLRDVAEREAVVPALMLVVLIVAVSSAGQAATILLGFGQFAGLYSPVLGAAAGTLVTLQLLGLAGNLIWVPVFWTILAAILYGVAYLLGGRGRFGGLWAASGFAFAPQLLLAPFTAVGDVLAPLGSGYQLLGWLVVLPVTIAMAIWTLILLAIAVRESMAISTGRAVGAIALLIGGVVGLAALIICALLFVFFVVAAALVA
jgi:hypothetical protein